MHLFVSTSPALEKSEDHHRAASNRNFTIEIKEMLRVCTCASTFACDQSANKQGTEIVNAVKPMPCNAGICGRVEMRMSGIVLQLSNMRDFYSCNLRDG